MNDLIINEQTIQNKIYTIRGLQVMLDSDLALLYQVETRVFNQAVKRNIKRFPNGFRFQLVEEEFQNLTSQIVTSSEHGGRRHLPYAFTEQGVSMLSAVLKSDTAVDISIKIIETFVAMRKYIASNTLMFERFERIEQRLSLHDDNFNKIFDAIESKEFDLSHDRFLIIDEEIYHIGASLKDLGKKWFGFSKMDKMSFQMMGRIN